MKTKNVTADFADYADFKEAHELHEIVLVLVVSVGLPKAVVLYRRRAAPPEGTITEHGTRARSTIFLRVSSRTFAAKKNL